MIILLKKDGENMIEHWEITGDTHGDFSRFKNYCLITKQDPHTAIIILGDVGLNFTLDEQDNAMKNKLTKTYAFRIYCVRGNHEARPSDISDMHLIWDEDVNGEVWIQDKWPNIRYFKDVGVYCIGGYITGVIGGAYSVDKWYRLYMGRTWFANEQLDENERALALSTFKNGKVDFMLTHTCPISWEPTDLFLNGIDQNRVDKTMELMLEEIKENLDFKVWLFGHYHRDRLERPRVEQFFKNTEDMYNIWHRWEVYFATGNLDWWFNKSPNFYMGVEK